jgi:hypothetical protein
MQTKNFPMLFFLNATLLRASNMALDQVFSILINLGIHFQNQVASP